MRTQQIAIILALLIGFLLTACSGGSTPSPEPTMSSQDVLNTAEAIADATRNAATPTSLPTPVTPTATLPADTATPEPTATPSSVIARAIYNANVRQGPDETYEVIDFLLEGNEAEVIGRYDHPTMGPWWYLQRIGEGLNGWVWGGALNMSGNIALVPYWDPPPTSTPAPENSSASKPTEGATQAPEPTSTTEE